MHPRRLCNNHLRVRKQTGSPFYGFIAQEFDIIMRAHFNKNANLTYLWRCPMSTHCRNTEKREGPIEGDLNERAKANEGTKSIDASK